jgi:hypothetical protein
MKTIPRTSLTLLMSGLLIAAPVTAIRPPDINEDAAAAVFRYQFAHNESGIRRRAAAFCIGYGRGASLRDPPKSLIARFRKAWPRVKPASACRFDEKRGVNIDRASGRPALTFFVLGTSCTEAACTAEGGYIEGNLSASSATYQLLRQGSAWRVTVYRLDAIS